VNDRLEARLNTAFGSLSTRGYIVALRRILEATLKNAA
jgi:hypothetical protein